MRINHKEFIIKDLFNNVVMMEDNDYGSSRVIGLEGEDHFGSTEGGVAFGGKYICKGG